MPKMTNYAPGTFCWVDLATTDPQAATAFYGPLFEWTAEDVTTDPNMPYSMWSYQGCGVAACYPLTPAEGPVPHWNSFIRVDSADETLAKAESLGARVLLPAIEISEHGRMAVIADPSGAVVSLWQPRSHFGAAIDNQVGARSWSELLTRDTAAMGDFYCALFGWSSRTSASLMDGRYVIFERDGTPVAGMLEIQEDWGPMPAQWAVYFGVADCDAVVAATCQAGGRTLTETMDIASVGRFCYLTDPQGAAFSVIQFAHP